MIPLFKYHLAFTPAAGEGGVAIQEITADYYENDEMGDGDRAIPSVAFVRDVPDPEGGEGETIGLKVFELPVERIVYVRNVCEMPAPDAPDQAVPAIGDLTTDAEAAAHTTGDASTKEIPPHGGYPDPDQDAHNRALRDGL